MPRGLHPRVGWAAWRRRVAERTALQSEQHRQMSVHQVGSALAPAGLAGRLLGFDHRYPGGGEGAGQPGALAAGALDRGRQPGPGGVRGDPAQRDGVADAVVGKRAGGDHRTAWVGDLELVGVTVGIRADDSIDDFGEHGHWPVVLSPGTVNVGTGLGAVTAVAHL